MMRISMSRKKVFILKCTPDIDGLAHWSYVFLALTHRYFMTWRILGNKYVCYSVLFIEENPDYLAAFIKDYMISFRFHVEVDTLLTFLES